MILIGEIRTARRWSTQSPLPRPVTCVDDAARQQCQPGTRSYPAFLPEEQHDQILMDLSLNLRGIVAQQLIRRPDGNGRRAIMEVMLNTPLVSI